MSTASLFLVFVIVMLAISLALIVRYSAGGTRTFRVVALLVWLGYVGLMGQAGVFANATARPPGPSLLFGPLVVGLAVLLVRVLAKPAAGSSVTIPLWVLTGVQTFRVIVELFIHQMWRDGLAPRMITYSGANMDIYIGATAPLLAWWVTRGAVVRQVAVAWNIIGLLVLANVVVRAILTSPGPLNLIHAEVPNRMIGLFPYMFIPALFVPLAVVLHALSLRALVRPNTTAA